MLCLNAINTSAKIVSVVNSNNPTGTAVDPDDLEEFIKQVPDDVLCVIDEAYYEVMPKDKQLDLIKHINSGKENLLILRTFSKGYGLAGLRIGYGIGSSSLITKLNKIRQPFNVNAMAQSAALAALDDDEYIESCREKIVHGVQYLSNQFNKLGLETVPSAANFILVKTMNGKKVFEDLQKRKIIVRPMNVYNLPDYVRVSVGKEDQNQKIINAFSEIF